MVEIEATRGRALPHAEGGLTWTPEMSRQAAAGLDKLPVRLRLRIRRTSLVEVYGPMPEETRAPSFAETPVDDRALFIVADSVVQTVAELSDDLVDTDAAWRAYADWKGPGYADYVQAIRQTGHSIFYYQLQEIYEFGQAAVGPDDRDSFCHRSGRTFMRRFFVGTILPFLQAAFATPGAFQETVVEILRSYLALLAGEKYEFSSEISSDAIRVDLGYRGADEMSAYCRRYGLDPERSFSNSFGFITGGFAKFLLESVSGFEAEALTSECSGFTGSMKIPVRESDHFDFAKLIDTLMGYIRDVELRQRQVVEDDRLESDLIVGSGVMRDTWERIRRASRTREIVLLRGESGTGKSFIARKIHALSPRAGGPFIEVGLLADIGSDNMIQSNLFGHEKGAFTGAADEKKGLFSLADGGTILLDEIGDASPELQAKLLKVIEASTFKRLGGVEDIEVDVRVIAATNRDLEAMVQDGSFRRDLYYRLNVIPVRLPPLRDRPEEIPALCDFLLARSSARLGRSPEPLGEGMLSQLMTYGWPGNIRELDHALKHATAMAAGDDISIEHMPEAVRSAVTDVPSAPDIPRPEGPALTGGVIDIPALRTVIRSSGVLTSGDTVPTHELPAHVDFAKRVWLGELIDHFGGDLTLIGRFWDRSAEKTLRKLVRAYGLEGRLEEARSRRREGKSSSGGRS